MSLIHEHWQVVVVGGGAAGLVAAERAASRGIRTLLLEKNSKLGVKILMSGGTRCNLTHATDARGIVEAYGRPGRFLHSALAALSPQDLVALVENEGVATKVEDTGKIFPVSDRAVDILRAFTDRLYRSGCHVALKESLVDLKQSSVDKGAFELTTTNRTLLADQVVITTGGQSYPGCGTTGDGYRWAQSLGHTIVRPRPALVPISVSTPWVQSLSGITIPDVELQLWEPAAKKPLDKRRGSLLFTHFGLSGPVALDISRGVSGHERPQSLTLQCDFLPSMSRGDLETQIQSSVGAVGKRQVLSLVPELLPRRLAEMLLCNVAGLSIDQKIGELSKAGRAALLAALKNAPIHVAGTRGFAKAEVTAGGVALGEVDSRTMQSKLQPGLYLAGEVLDLDGPIGGYNFQAAFSTGWLAGLSVAAESR